MKSIFESDLHTIKGIMHYLNDIGDNELSFDVIVADSNGDQLGSIVRVNNVYELRVGA